MWRLPLPDDYVEYLHSDIADRHSSPSPGAGSVVAALFLREFLGDRRTAGPTWTCPRRAGPRSDDGELTKGATGWGARTLLRGI